MIPSLGKTQECCILNPYYKADGWGFKADNREFSLYRTAKDELFVREAITITDMEYGTYGDCYLNGEVDRKSVV